LDRNDLTAKHALTFTSSTIFGGIASAREDWVSNASMIAVLRPPRMPAEHEVPAGQHHDDDVAALGELERDPGEHVRRAVVEQRVGRRRLLRRARVGDPQVEVADPLGSGGPDFQGCTSRRSAIMSGVTPIGRENAAW
jgi:hypothetical protein